MKYCDERLREYEDFNSHIFYIEENENSAIEVLVDGFTIFSKSDKSTDKKFKKLFRKRGHRILPYFKVIAIDCLNEEVTNVCRISMYEPKYLTGYGENMILNKDQVNKLIDLLNKYRYADICDLDSKYAEYFPKDLTNWKFIIESRNNEFDVFGIKYRIPNNLKMPDYTKLLED